MKSKILKILGLFFVLGFAFFLLGFSFDQVFEQANIDLDKYIIVITLLLPLVRLSGIFLVIWYFKKVLK